MFLSFLIFLRIPRFLSFLIFLTTDRHYTELDGSGDNQGSWRRIVMEEGWCVEPRLYYLGNDYWWVRAYLSWVVVVLSCAVLYCVVVCWVVLYCIVLWCGVLWCVDLWCVVFRYCHYRLSLNSSHRSVLLYFSEVSFDLLWYELN